VRDDGADGGEVAERRAKAARHHPVGGRLVMVVAMGAGADQRDFVHNAAHVRQQLANMRAGYIGGDGPIDAANLFRRIRLEIEAVMVRQPAAQIDEDDRASPRLPPIGRRIVRFRLQRAGKRQAADGADAEKIAAREAVAAMRFPSQK